MENLMKNIFKLLPISLLMCPLFSSAMEKQNQLDLLIDQSQCTMPTSSTDKQSPITMSQLYYHFSHPSHDLLLPEITQQIFSLQLGTVDLADLPLNCKSPESFVKYLEALITSCGYLLASELCECYLKYKEISLCDIQDENKRTCLHKSISPKVTEMLIKIAGDTASTLIAMQNTSGSTALHWAAWNNRTEIVKLLLEAAGDTASTLLTKQNEYGNTALHYAADNNCTESVKLILEAAGVDACKLIAMEATSGYTALHYAANHNNTEIVKLLLDASGDTTSTLLTKQNEYCKTALHYANPATKEVMQKYMTNK
jgi:ankyrin repeat protein